MRTVLYFTKPPSLNRLYPTNPKTGRRQKSKEYDQWIAMAMQEVMIQPRNRHEGRVRVAYAVPRGSALADIGNIEKGCSDLLVKMGVIKDDRFIEGIFIAWADVEKVRVRIADVANDRIK